MGFAVSVCVPVYNGDRYLGECLDSIRAQTFEDIEIVIVDDGSTDNSVAIAKGYAKIDSKIRFTQNSRTLGLVGNWNRCIELAQGEWVKFVFQDDLIEPSCISQMIEAARPDVDLVAVKREFIFESGTSDSVKEFYNVYMKKHCFTRNFPFKSYVSPGEFSDLMLRVAHGNCIGEPSAVLVRRAAFSKYGRFNCNIVSLCDWECFARVSANTGLSYVDLPLAHFRVHSASRSAEIRDRWNYRASTIDDLIIQYQLITNTAFAIVRQRARLHNPPIRLEQQLVKAVTQARWQAARLSHGSNAMWEWWKVLLQHPKMLIYFLKYRVFEKLENVCLRLGRYKILLV